MLFMTILTWEPEKRDAVIKRTAEKGTVTAGKIIGQWGAIAGGRAFRVVELDDPKGAAALLGTGMTFVMSNVFQY